VNLAKIIKMPINKLHGAAYNPRTINDGAMKGLEASMDRWGLVQPIVWNKRTNNVVGGHQRLDRPNKRIDCGRDNWYPYWAQVLP
jgi:ParB-like chromosome segregation protein Spo0J